MLALQRADTLDTDKDTMHFEGFCVLLEKACKSSLSFSQESLWNLRSLGEP